MDQTVNKAKKAKSEKDLWVLFNVCTMLFAAISFYTTAEGMKKYFFNGNEIGALFSSFGIQALLVGLNLKLAKYIAAKSSLARRCIIVLYGVTVLWSSGFSFVYIANSVYAPVWMADGQIVLTNTYISVVSRLDKLVTPAFEGGMTALLGDITAMKEIASRNDEETENAMSSTVLNFGAMKADFSGHAGMTMVISTLEKLQSGDPVGDISQAIRILNQEKSTLNAEITRLESEITAYETSIQTANSNAANLITLRARVPTRSAAHTSYTEQITQEQGQAAELSRKKSTAESEKNHQKLLLADVVNLTNLASLKTASTGGILEADFSSIIAELGSATPDIAKISVLADSIYTKISVTMKSDGNSAEYAEILNLYTHFQSSLMELGRIRDIQIFLNQKEDFLLDTGKLVSSEPTAEAVGQWRNLWNTKLSELKNSFYQLPLNSDGNDKEDKEIWKINATITGLQRNWLLDLNGIERAILYLFSDYPKLAWFSLILSLYFDASPILISLFKYYDKSTDNASVQKKRIYKMAFAGSTMGVLFLAILLIK